MWTHFKNTLFPSSPSSSPSSSGPSTASSTSPTTSSSSTNINQADCPLCRLTGTSVLSFLSLSSFYESYRLNADRLAGRNTSIASDVPKVPSRGRVAFLGVMGGVFAVGAVGRWELERLRQWGWVPRPAAVHHEDRSESRMDKIG